MAKQAISTDNAPGALGPYNQAIVANGFVFVSGQGGIDPTSKEIVDGGVEAQTQQTLNNVKAILEAAGSSMDNVVKTTVFLSDMGNFKAMNAVYATFFGDVPPARSTVEVAELPLGLMVEIEVVALV